MALTNTVMELCSEIARDAEWFIMPILPRGKTVNAACYFQMLCKLKCALCNKNPLYSWK